MKKNTKDLGFYLTFKAAVSQITIFTSLANDIDVTINNLYLYPPVFIPDSKTHVMFNESIENNYTITYHSWYTERKVPTDGKEFQVDIGSAQHVSSAKYLIGAFQTADGIGTPNKENNIAIFDKVILKKYFCGTDGYRYPKDAALTNFPENDYPDQNRDLKLFYKEYVS